MKVLAFNGSPRKTWNAATLLNKALEGAASQGASPNNRHSNLISGTITGGRSVETKNRTVGSSRRDNLSGDTAVFLAGARKCPKIHEKEV